MRFRIRPIGNNRNDDPSVRNYLYRGAFKREFGLVQLYCYKNRPGSYEQVCFDAVFLLIVAVEIG